VAVGKILPEQHREAASDVTSHVAPHLIAMAKVQTRRWDSGRAPRASWRCRSAPSASRHAIAWQHRNGCMKPMPKEEELLQMPGHGPRNFAPLLAALGGINFQSWADIFMHRTPRGIPIVEGGAAAVTAEITSRPGLPRAGVGRGIARPPRERHLALRLTPRACLLRSGTKSAPCGRLIARCQSHSPPQFPNCACPIRYW
jgi:hypothetical protein